MEILRLNSIQKRFKEKEVLRGINLSLKKGEILGLVGKSGSGKSVLIKTIIGFLEPNSGKVIINSSSNNSLNYSMQENAIYDDLTVNQNLDYFASINKIKRKIRKEKINTLLKETSLEEYKKVLVRNLSGGTKKRVDLACSLMTDPEVLILDEPLLGLDPSLINSMAKLIRKLNEQGKTIIISSHQIEELYKICSRVVLLKEGTLYEIKKNEIRGVYD